MITWLGADLGSHGGAWRREHSPNAALTGGALAVEGSSRWPRSRVALLAGDGVFGPVFEQEAATRVPVPATPSDSARPVGACSGRPRSARTSAPRTDARRRGWRL